MRNNKIDEYIAIKVLGFKKVETVKESPYTGNELTVTEYIKDGVRTQGFIIEGMLPPYSASFIQSFMLLEKLRTDGEIYDYKIMSPVSPNKTFDVYIRSKTDFNRVLSGKAYSTELPKAICLAIIAHHKDKKRNALRTTK